MSDGLVPLLKDLCAPLGVVGFRRMFGGVGLFGPAGMFGLVAGDVLYLKSDGATTAAFDAEALEAFSYVARGETRVIGSYRRAPDRIFEDPDEFRSWAEAAIAVAARAAVTRPASPKRRRGRSRI